MIFIRQPLDLTTDVEVLTVPQAAALTGRRQQAIRYWIETGHVRAARAGDRWLVAKADVTDNMTVPEAATYMGVTPQAVNHHIRNGNLPATKAGRLWLIPREAVEQFASARTRGVYLPPQRLNARAGRRDDLRPRPLLADRPYHPPSKPRSGRIREQSPLGESSSLGRVLTS